MHFGRRGRPTDYRPKTLSDYKANQPQEYVELGKLQPDLMDEELVAKRANQDRVKEFSQQLRKINTEQMRAQQIQNNKYRGSVGSGAAKGTKGAKIGALAGAAGGGRASGSGRANGQGGKGGKGRRSSAGPRRRNGAEVNGTEEKSSREKAIEFARKVPKPKVNKAAKAKAAAFNEAGGGGFGSTGARLQEDVGALGGGKQRRPGRRATDSGSGTAPAVIAGAVSPCGGEGEKMSALDELELKHDQARADVEAIRREFGL